MRFTTFFNEIKKYPEKCFDYYRMSILSFEELLEKIRPKITKENITHLRNPISAEERLTVTFITIIMHKYSSVNWVVQMQHLHHQKIIEIYNNI